MKLKSGIFPAVSLALGILIGWALPHPGPPDREQDPHPPSKPVSRSASPSLDLEEPGNRTRRERPAPGTGDGYVRVPTKEVEALLKARFGKSTFDWVTRELPQFLPFLGASPQEAESILARFKEAIAEISGLEKSLVRVKAATPDQITLDTSAMAGAEQEVARRLQQTIRETLPEASGEALVNSIVWERLYHWSGDVQFQITRDPDGKLRAVRENVEGGSRMSIDAREFPDDGSPIPASGIFISGNWPELLKDLTLTPPPRAGGP